MEKEKKMLQKKECRWHAADRVLPPSERKYFQLQGGLLNFFLPSVLSCNSSRRRRCLNMILSIIFQTVVRYRIAIQTECLFLLPSAPE